MNRTAPRLRSERLSLVPYRESDLAAATRILTDPRVIWWRETPMTGAEVQSFIERAIAAQNDGYGWWFLETQSGDLLGHAALKPLPGTEWIEVGYHLLVEGRGRGYATEGARALLTYGFKELGLSEIHAVVLPSNTPSQAVMARLGMARIGTHIQIGLEHDLFRMRQREWAAVL